MDGPDFPSHRIERRYTRIAVNTRQRGIAALSRLRTWTRLPTGATTGEWRRATAITPAAPPGPTAARASAHAPLPAATPKRRNPPSSERPLPTRTTTPQFPAACEPSSATRLASRHRPPARARARGGLDQKPEGRPGHGVPRRAGIGRGS